MGQREADRLRAMYVGGQGKPTARRYARFWGLAFRLGLLPRRWVTLEVRGRRTGRVTRFPLGMADVAGQWYLVSMLGECHWVANVRAAGGTATLWCGRARRVELVEVPVDGRAAVIQRYVRKVPGGRPHIPVDRHEPVEAFEAIAADYPVFRVVPRGSTSGRHSGGQQAHEPGCERSDSPCGNSEPWPRLGSVQWWRRWRRSASGFAAVTRRPPG